jgi:hypothetical protein
MSIESLRVVIPPSLLAHKTPILFSTALVALFSYGLHQRSVATRVSRQSVEMASQLKDTRVQVDALTAKLNSTTEAQPPLGRPSPANSAHQQAARRPAAKIPKPDPRWRRMQTQLDAQGQAINSTREELANTRSDLQGSIAKTHEELVVLQKKGERNYFEFDLDKSKNFHSAGPVGVSLRKANTKHQYADLELLVDDRQLSKKHLNLYEPVVFYPSDERQTVELIVISIAKNHIHGYISAPKYKTSELAAVSGNAGDTAPNANGQMISGPRPRQRLAMGH